MELTAATITRPQQEVYDFWWKFEQLASLTAHVDDVGATGVQVRPAPARPSADPTRAAGTTASRGGAGRTT